jgi:peroxiredoxin
MIRRILTVATVAVTFLSLHAYAVRIGDSAPDFKGTDSNGNTQSLSQYKGKYVVLEWTNHDCPFTRKHYAAGNMQSLQKEWTAKGIVWLSIISSAPGEQGYMTAPEENSYLREVHAAPTAAILDPAGAIGREYEAKTTPHIFIIDPAGKVIYEGAIDDHPSADPEDIKSSKNYVSEALSQSLAGQPVATAVTRPYGCSVKYAH